jgi:hypothetical protein
VTRSDHHRFVRRTEFAQKGLHCSLRKRKARARDAEAAIERHGNREGELPRSKVRYLLRLTVFAHLEVIARQPGDWLPIGVGHACIDFDEIDP